MITLLLHCVRRQFYTLIRKKKNEEKCEVPLVRERTAISNQECILYRRECDITRKIIGVEYRREKQRDSTALRVALAKICAPFHDY